MLIKFQSNATAPFSMLADAAKPLLQGMGQGGRLEGSVSGAILRDAQTLLLAALKQAGQATGTHAPESIAEETDEEPPVALSVRAVPLLEMMRKALAEDSFVMWQPE